jgi:adenine-specific DNA-methyltransferase
VDDVMIWEGNCLVRMREIIDGSVSLIATDPPYFRVKMAEDWDRQWPDVAAYLAWIGELCREWRRVLAPNGSLYVFASPEMAAKVECKIGETFEILNSIVWDKGDGSGAEKGARGGLTRTYINQTERIIFAEHFGSDSHAKGEAGYEAKCDQLRGFIFEPLRAYIRGEMEAAGLVPRDINRAVGSSPSGGGMASHYVGNTDQWELPTEEHYRSIKSIASGYFRREYEDLRREYEDLRREYEDLRRPFCVNDSVPYTDVWDFPTVPARLGKHPCEKPLAMMEHIMGVSSRPGDLVLDCFAGSGVTGRACRNLGRRCVLIEKDEHWAKAASLWLDRPHAYLPREKVAKPMPLFARIDIG